MTLRLTAHCVAVTDRWLLLQRHGQKKLQWLCVQWDSLSVGLTSPFYEHELELREVSEATADAPTLYAVEQWQACQPRLTEDGEGFPARVRTLLKQSFFPMMTRTAGTVSADLLPWEMRGRALSTRHRQDDEFALAQCMQYDGTAIEFWRQHQKRHTADHKTLLSSLELGFCRNLVDLHSALERWPRQHHLTPWLRHRLLEMSSLFTVCCHQDWLPLAVATLSPAAVKDLACLHQQFRQLARGGRLLETATTRHPPSYSNLPSLLRHTLQQHGGLTLMMQHYLPEATVATRRVLLDQVLVRALIEAFETQAQSDSSTCYPVTLKSLHWHYCTLVGLPATDEDLRSLLPFDATAVDDAESDPMQLSAILGRFPLLTLAANSPCRFQWQLVKHDAPLTKPYSPLFLLQSKPEELSRERHLQQLWQQPWRHCTLLQPPDSSEWDVEEWRHQYDAMDSVDRQLWDQRWTLVLVAPVAVATGQDLKLVERLLRSDFYGTSLVRPPKSPWSHRRLMLHFQQLDLPLDDLRDRLHYCGEPGALRDTVVVLDAHLYSYAEMQSLLQWLNEEKHRVQRVVMLGQADTHPLHCDGHALVDLAQWHDRDGVRTLVFAQAQHQQDFHALLQALQVHQVQARDLQPLLQQLQGKCSGLTLRLLVEKRQKRPSVLELTVESALNAKFVRAHSVTLRPVVLAELFQCDVTGDQGQQRHIVVVTRAFVQQLRRNELHHLLLEQDCLCILCDEPPRADLNWLTKLVERQTFPNLRHTLPFLLHCEKQAGTLIL